MSIDVAAFGKVAVLMGGTSAERPISLLSGQGVLDALRGKGVDAHAFDPAERPLSALRDDGVGRCFITLHGRHGEDGTVQGALELLGIPYTGPGVLASAIAVDKTMAKRVWSVDGLALPAQVLLQRGDAAPSLVDDVVARLGLPLIVKPTHEGSSIGVSKVVDAAALHPALELAWTYGEVALCEEFIDGEEVTCALLGRGAAAIALPVIRIQAPGGAYDYQNKYFTDVVRYLCPSGLPEEEEQAIRQASLAAYRALGCRGWSRADLMVRASDRRPFLIELNTSPGMTTHSLVPMAAKAVGIDYPALCLQILASAALDAGGATR